MRWVSERRFLHFIEDIKNIFARKDEVPKKLSDLENDIGGMFEEKDPTVPSWAKNPTKPKYTANEVGALPDTTKIPSKTSDLQNDSGFLTEHQDLSGYALKSEVPKSASDVGADASGTAVTKVSEHNAASNAHNDIRILIQGLTERLNSLADSDDTTLDQMSEVVAYIKSNKSLIDAITTSKVSVTDIIDNLTTNVANKPLSAAQGVALKALIDAITTVELDETLTDNTKAAPADVVGKLKGDLANKLPKSPANWGPWTAEEQAAARNKIGVSGYELICDVTLEEAIDDFVRDTYSDGTPYNLSKALVFIYVPVQESGYVPGTCWIYFRDLKNFNAGRLYYTSSSNTNRPFIMKAEQTTSNGVWSLPNGECGQEFLQSSSMNVYNVKTKISNICAVEIWCSLPVGTIVQIYGVRA